MTVNQQGTTQAARTFSDRTTDLLAAVQFLTRLPVPALRWRDDTLAYSLLFFPLIGLALGAAAGGLYQLLAAHLAPTLAAALTIAALIAFTGALHEDGLADCADAFGSLQTRARTLEILKDSRIGTYGAIALGLSLLTRIFAIVAIPSAKIVAMLAVSLMLSRCSILPLSLLRPATPNRGRGSLIAGQTPRAIIIAGVLFSIAVSIALLRGQALPMLLAATFTSALCALFFHRRLGGVTGDCFGATVQLVEVALLLVAAWT